MQIHLFAGFQKWETLFNLVLDDALIKSSIVTNPTGNLERTLSVHLMRGDNGIDGFPLTNLPTNDFPTLEKVSAPSFR